jgi:hypothetical protein
MAAPSIKGSVFAAIIEDVQKLLADKKVKREELSRWLKGNEPALIDQTVHAHEWYDIRFYARLSQLLRDVAGGGRNDYLVRRGERSAQRLLDGGLYAQLEYGKTAKFGRDLAPEERFAALGRDLTRTTTLSASILNFGKWTPKPDPDRPRRWLIEITQARDFPDELAWSSLGFVNELARSHNQADLWTWERPEPDRIVYRMTRDR